MSRCSGILQDDYRLSSDVAYAYRNRDRSEPPGPHHISNLARAMLLSWYQKDAGYVIVAIDKVAGAAVQTVSIRDVLLVRRPKQNLFWSKECP